MLGAGFQKTLTETEFLAQAQRSKLVIDNVTGEDMKGSVEAVLTISPAVEKKLMLLAPVKKVKGD